MLFLSRGSNFKSAFKKTKVFFLKKAFEQAFLETKLNVLYKLVQTFPSPWDGILSCMDNPKAITGAEIWVRKSQTGISEVNLFVEKMVRRVKRLQKTIKEEENRKGYFNEQKGL